MKEIDVRDERIVESIHQLIELCGEASDTFSSDLITQMIQNSLKLMLEGHDLGQLKLINRALKEMRHAYSIFNKYPNARCISIFGSARTPETHPDYQAAKELSIEMANAGWMCITGAADGIMKAGLEGTQKASSFGLSIRLPFESPVNSLIEGDPKLMMFRYFFTRKLMFISHADAVAAFPGGVGTLDELFEVLTLMQTGKAQIIPVILAQGKNGEYWQNWQHYMNDHLLGNGWISPEDRYFYHFAASAEDARSHIMQFYRRYHSSRYVNDQLVIRMLTPLDKGQVKTLNHKFASLLASGEITLGNALPEETDFLELPRLVFHHTRKKYGLVRALIDEINQF